ncbi:MAG: PVC-type heme-binding CxxCH protein [Verrucomicrobiota bacterium]
MIRRIPFSFFLALMTGAGANPPVCTDPAVTITLVAEHPDIVTPTGVAVDKHGRVFVLENHTHFRPEGYEGPERDRILIFEDGKELVVFHEGLLFGTDLLFDKAGHHLFATTRAKVLKFKHASEKDLATKPDLLVDLETPGMYPHNGVSGLAFDEDGILHFGFGENLGEDYTFIGSDGVKISGGGEGGSAYRCQPDGSNLERMATGFWNPFGMTFLGGDLFAVGNDPGSAPPCRLLHVVDGADFGFEFRYGRSGLNPLISWTGEIPGTVPMAGPTGEAPCGVIPLGNDLLVASWADHRIDRHVLAPKGASFAAKREDFIQGGDDFRPVHMAWAPDGKTLFVTDWVSASYQLHQQGRLWKVSFPEQAVRQGDVAMPPDGAMAAAIRGGDVPFDVLAGALSSEDAYIRSAAIFGLGKHDKRLKDFDWQKQDSPTLRANFGVALRRHLGKSAESQIPVLLADPSAEVRYVGIKWVADEMLVRHRADIEKLLTSSSLGQREFLAVMAALDRLDGTKKVRDVPDPEKLLGVIANEETPANLRALALRMVPVEHKKLSVARLKTLFAENDKNVRLEVVRSLQHHPDTKRGEFLVELARDESLDSKIRLEAIVGLAALAEDHREALENLARSVNEISEEARRALAGLEGVPEELARMVEPKPLLTQTEEWVEFVGTDLAGADAEEGRRLYFHSKLATCYRCHQMEGRGIRVGPELTTIRERGDVAWLLEHILQPFKEVAPQFLPWVVTTTDGETHTGLPLRKGGKQETYLGVDGKEFSLRKESIVTHQEMQMSLMPAGLLDPLTKDEIRNLLAFLLRGSEERP